MNEAGNTNTLPRFPDTRAWHAHAVKKAGQMSDPVFLSGHNGNVWRCAFNSSCDRLVSSSSDETVRVWDLSTGRASLVFEDHGGVVHSCDFCPHSNLIVSCSWDRTTRIRDVSTGLTVSILSGIIIVNYLISFL